MKKAIRSILWVVGALVVIAAIVLIVVTWFVRRPFPRVRGTETVAGLSAPVEIFRDEDGVPHIYASTMEDLYFAQGYVHAQDRFWQMEFWRRIGAGRLSEILGDSALDQDRYLRTMGFARVAGQEYNRLSPDHRSWLDAYAAGVNGYVLDRRPGRLGLEFAFLQLTGVSIEIEPWTGVNSLTWAKIMAMDLGANMGNELSNLSLVRFGGTPFFELIRSPYRGDMPFIVSMDEIAAYRAEAGLSPLPQPEVAIATVYTAGTAGVGSNNWVIGPERTTTGAPILANDMHLGVQIPSIWYEVGLHMDPPAGSQEAPLNLRGFSFAGVPGIVAGQNDHVAWGMTNLGGDVQDLHLERINPQDPDEYWDGQQWQEMDIRLEEIRVEGETEPVILKVRSTSRGPILTDLPQMDKWSSFVTDGAARYPDAAAFFELSLEWTALKPETLWNSVVELNRATSAAEVREALRLWASPAQNLVFADDQGNIGYQSTGVFPDRPPADGRAPTPGWEAKAVNTVPFDAYPAILNPEKGYIVTANNPVISPEYPYPLGVSFAHGLRARRIVDMIEDLDTGIGPDQVAEMHADVYNRTADELLPYLESVSLEGAHAKWVTDQERWLSQADPDAEAIDIEANLEYLARAAGFLFEWDRNMDPDSAGAAAYGYVWKALIEETFADEVPAHYWPITGVTGFESAFHTLIDEPDHAVWDDVGTDKLVETRDDTIGRALVKGLLAARDEMGDDPEKWEWGAVHQIEFRNATLGESGIGLVERLFNRGPFPIPGDTSTVNVSHWSLREPFDTTTIVSERAIYDLSDPSNSRFTHPTGQSGHPYHRHYLGFFDEWSQTRYHPARWTREEVEQSAGRRVLTLRPAAN